MNTTINQTAQKLHEVAQSAFEGSEANTLTFPEGVRMVAAAGFNGYLVDYRSGSRTYHHSNGEVFTFQGHVYPPVDTFDVGIVKTAIKEAQLLVPGYTYQGFLGQRIADRRLCWIIRRFLQAGVLEEGIVKPTNEGAPQGGPLSPILSNLVLDELDKELERRGLRFVRYADDQNVFVRSEQAAQRAFENLTEFIEGRLKLKVNRAKSAVARPWQRKLLGFSFTEGKTTKRTIAPKALAKARERIRKLTARGHCNFQAMMAGLRQYLVGWLGYFRFCQTPRVLAVLEAWTHRRLRALIWRQWKCGRTRFAELVKRGVRLESAAIAAGVSRGPWRQSRNPLLLWIFSKAWFIEHGLPSFNARA